MKSPGGFFVGLIMMIVGAYLLLVSIEVSNRLSFGYAMFAIGGHHVTTGMVFIPLIFGIGMIFYNPDNNLGWLLVILSGILLLFGIISSLNLHLRNMSAFELIMILVLLVGGIGLFLGSLCSKKNGIE
jgi:hypothetical protein